MVIKFNSLSLDRVQRITRDEFGVVAMIFGMALMPLIAMTRPGRRFRSRLRRQIATQSRSTPPLSPPAGSPGRDDRRHRQGFGCGDGLLQSGQAEGRRLLDAAILAQLRQTAFTVTATSWVKTPFLGVLKFLIKKPSAAAHRAPARATTSCMRLTTTATAELEGRRRRRQQRRGRVDARRDGLDVHAVHEDRRAKPAAKDLIDIVVWDDQSQYTSRIALAPFAEAVNVGTTLAPLVRGTVTYGHADAHQSRHDQHVESSRPSNGSSSRRRAAAAPTTWQISTKCVTERIGTDKYTDVAPTSTATYVGKGYFGTNADTSCGVGNYTRSPRSTPFIR